MNENMDGKAQLEAVGIVMKITAEYHLIKQQTDDKEKNIL